MRHYSGRGVSNRSTTLWSSWSVIGPQHRIFYSGDSGYGKLFQDIGTRLGPFDMAFIKIGAYGPGAAWTDIHMTPEQAVQVHRDVRARRMFPVHWSTFNLAYHDWDEPIRRTVAEATRVGVELVIRNCWWAAEKPAVNPSLPNGARPGLRNTASSAMKVSKRPRSPVLTASIQVVCTSRMARSSGAGRRRTRSVLTTYPRQGVMRGNHRLTFAR